MARVADHRDDDAVQVVLITSLSSGRWIFPKGVIDPGETPESTALKEAREEAGVVGGISGEALGVFEQEKWGGVARVEVFPLLVSELLDDWDEQVATAGGDLDRRSQTKG